MIGPPPYDEGRGRRDSCLVSTVTGRLVSDVWRCCTILGVPTDAFNMEKASEVASPIQYWTVLDNIVHHCLHAWSQNIWRLGTSGFLFPGRGVWTRRRQRQSLNKLFAGPTPMALFSCTHVLIDTLNKCFITTYKINELQIAMFAHSPHYWKCSVTYCYIITSSAYSCKTPAIRCRIKATLWISRVWR